MLEAVFVCGTDVLAYARRIGCMVRGSTLQLRRPVSSGETRLPDDQECYFFYRER